MKKALLFLAGLGAAAVIAMAAVRWKEFDIRFKVFRLAGNPDLQDAWLERPADSSEGKAVRMYFRSRPAEVIRLFFRFVRTAARQDGEIPVELMDLQGQDRVTIVLESRLDTPEKKSRSWMDRKRSLDLGRRLVFHGRRSIPVAPRKRSASIGRSPRYLHRSLETLSTGRSLAAAFSDLRLDRKGDPRGGR